MADALELHEGEVVEKEFKSDYWEKTLCFYSQKRGKYWLTNQNRIQGRFCHHIGNPLC